MADGRVTDATRIEAAVPTITELADKGAIVLILAHFDRPKGERRPDMSLSLVTRPLSEVLGRSVMLISDSHGPDAERAGARLAPGDRSEERRVGTESVRTLRSRWSPLHYKTNNYLHTLLNNDPV